MNALRERESEFGLFLRKAENSKSFRGNNQSTGTFSQLCLFFPFFSFSSICIWVCVCVFVCVVVDLALWGYWKDPEFGEVSFVIGGDLRVLC